MMGYWISSWRISIKIWVLCFNLLLYKALNVWDFIQTVYKQLWCCDIALVMLHGLFLVGIECGPFIYEGIIVSECQ